MRSRVAKSKDYDVRAAVVRSLLDQGVPRRDIRHEITLDTASSGGRSDVVVLRNRLIGIEIKSGSDKLDRLRDQMDGYRRAFDLAHIVCDVKHFQAAEYWRYKHNMHWWCPKLGFLDWAGSIALDGPPEFIQCQPWRNEEVSHAPVTRLLWKNEAARVSQRLGGPNGTRVTSIAWLRENARLRELRPLVIEELRARVPNLWEEAFWKRFDKSTEPVPMEDLP